MDTLVNSAGAPCPHPTRNKVISDKIQKINKFFVAIFIAILNMTRALSDAVARDGILVNTICPGLTNTQRARDLQQARAEKEGRDPEQILQEFGSNLPAGRIAEPEEIADVVAFLASAPCSYMHGSSLYMDGGERRGTP